MELGLLTAPLPNQPLIEVARWAAGAGFSQLEVAAWPGLDAAQRRYAGTAHLPVADLSVQRAGEIVAELAEAGMTISGLAYYPNNLDPDPAVRAQANAHTLAVIDAAAALGVPVVNTFIGGAPGRCELPARG